MSRSRPSVGVVWCESAELGKWTRAPQDSLRGTWRWERLRSHTRTKKKLQLHIIIAWKLRAKELFICLFWLSTPLRCAPNCYSPTCAYRFLRQLPYIVEARTRLTFSTLCCFENWTASSLKSLRKWFCRPTDDVYRFSISVCSILDRSTIGLSWHLSSSFILCTSGIVCARTVTARALIPPCEHSC